METYIDSPLDKAKQLYEHCLKDALPSQYVIFDYFGCEKNKARQKIIL